MVSKERFIARPELEFTKTAVEFDSQGEPLVELAFEIAKVAHRGQERKNGEPYINHVVAVASIVRDVFGIKDPEMIASALFHDVVEDCADVSQEQLSEISDLINKKTKKLDLRFVSETIGEEAAFSVDSVTKLSTTWETIKKLLLNIPIDPKGAVIKLADRWHNMSTLNDMSEEKQIEKSLETRHVYTHLAESLGMWVMKNKLADLAFKYLEPENYAFIADLVDRDPRLNSAFIEGMVADFNEWMSLQCFSGRVEVRVKGYYESNEKWKRLMEEGNCLDRESMSDMNDLVSFRILVKDLGEADRVLGKLRRDFKKEVEVEEFSDTITEPSDNGYSAYHVSLRVNGKKIEVAITTEEREEYNNWGVVSLLRKGKEVADYSRIMVFSPNNELHFLPPGATGVDYARAISPRLLAQAVGMIVDGGEMVEITQKVPNAASVFIVTDKTRMAADPSWINASVTKEAKREILRQQEQLAKNELIEKGKQLMEEILSERGLFKLEDLNREEFDLVRYALHVGGRMSDIYTKLGMGTLSIERVRRKLDEAKVLKETEGSRRTSIRIAGPDKEGTIATIAAWVYEAGGTLAFSTNRADGQTYTARLMLNGLNREDELRLKSLMEADELRRFTQIEIV